MSDKNNRILVFDRSKNGDLKTFYSRKIDMKNKDRTKVFRWHPHTNKIDGGEGIESVLDWKVQGADERMLNVF
jgi:hypothetical protein